MSIKRILVLFWLMLLGLIGLVLLPQNSVFAAATPVGPDATTDSLFSLDPFFVSAIVGVIIPLLVAFFTDASVSVPFKRLLTAILAAVGGVITVGATDGGGSIISGSSVKAAILTAFSAVATYIMFLRNSKTEEVLNETGPNVGPKVTP